MSGAKLSKHLIARAGRALLTGLLVPILASVIGWPAAAEDDDMLDLGGAQPLPNTSLLSMRGGFSIGGFDISFGVTVRATIDGATELKTSFNVLPGSQIANQSVSLTDQGSIVYSTGGGGNASANSTSIPLSSSQAAAQSGQTNALTNGQVLASANGFTLVQLEGGGYALASVDTTVIQSVDNHSILSEVANTANARVIQTSISADLFFNNFAEMAGRADMSTLMSHIMAEQANAGMLGR